MSVVRGGLSVVKKRKADYKQNPSYHLRYFSGSGFQPRHLIPRLQAAPTFLLLAPSNNQKRKLSFFVEAGFIPAQKTFFKPSKPFAGLMFD